MKIINFNDMTLKQQQILSASQRSNIYRREDNSFFVFKNNEMIAMYILMENREHESYLGLSNHIDLDFDKKAYIYWIETFERTYLREILKCIASIGNISKFILESSGTNLSVWKHIGAVEYIDLYDDFREIHSLVINVDDL